MVVELIARYCLGITCTIMLSFFTSHEIKAQSKKEQIAMLSNRYDSLTLELKAINDLSNISIQSLNFKIDSMLQFRSHLKVDLESFKMELEKLNNNILLLMVENDSLI